MRRLALRRLRGDDGLSLIETVVALLVFSLIMSGLAAGMALFAHTTALTKVRNAATSMAQQTMEKARSYGPDTLAVCSGGGSPLKYKPAGMSKDFDVVTGSAPCLTYSQTLKNGGYSFTVKQYVLNDPVAGKAKGTSGKDQVEKILAVNVAWTSPTPGDYEVNSIVSGQGTVNTTVPTGLRINVNDSSTNPSTLITNDALVWDYTVTDGSGNVVASDVTADGSTGVISISPGTYTCKIIPESDAAQSYIPDTNNNPGMAIDAATTGISGPCSVTASQVTDWTTMWQPIANCSSSGTKGSLKVTVRDQNGVLVSGASVALTNVNGNGGTPAAQLSDANGVALFSGSVPDDLYTYTISKTGYITESNLGPVCVASTSTATADGTIEYNNGCERSATPGKLDFTIKDENGALVGGVSVVLTDSTGHTTSFSTDGSGHKSLDVVADSYTYELSKKEYTDIGPRGPVCLKASTTVTLVPVIQSAASYGCASSGSKGTMVVTVKDQDGLPVDHVKVFMTNANGHGGSQSPTTDPTGQVTKDLPADPYLLSVQPPAGYTVPPTQGPICMHAGETLNESFTLQGVMIVKVAVTNKDTQPTKTYNIKLTDGTGEQTSNTVSINATKSLTVQFNDMATGTYTVEVCVPSQTTGNCNTVYKTSNNAFTQINHTYNVTVTDTSGGA